MTTILRNRRVQLIGLPAAVIVLLAGLVALSVVSGFTEDLQTAYKHRNVWELGGGATYYGISSVEEMIVKADVIAVANLESVSRGVEKARHIYGSGPHYGYTKTLEYTFEVDQYLKGQDKERVVGVVTSLDPLYRTAPGAMFGKDPDKKRRTDWDNRRAVIFLVDYSKVPELNWSEGRYYLGYATDIDEFYSIGSVYERPWLPAASEDPNEEAFLLADDRKGTPLTISLNDLKGMVVEIEGALTGRSEEYIECISQAFVRQREASHRWKQYLREDASIWSGLAKDTHVHTTYVAPYRVALLQGEPIPEGYEGRYQISGRDQDYFYGEVPGEIYLERPLPAGEYRVYHAFLPYFLTPCGAEAPDAQLKSSELFISVTAPEGTVHEALFDPNETLAAAFTDGPVDRIAWEAEAGGVGTVKLILSPQASLAGHTVEFIALDGSVPLSLAVADAQVDATNGTLTWKVASQPWQSGDKLMLRIN